MLLEKTHRPTAKLYRSCKQLVRQFSQPEKNFIHPIIDGWTVIVSPHYLPELTAKVKQLHPDDRYFNLNKDNLYHPIRIWCVRNQYLEMFTSVVGDDRC
ncbi:MAG: hypothetical protein N5P05_004443 (plasmid) [Chroococcopsis gigantea SAG 12.99]|nr:hypothetical protein [Chlorogloea purpurea SAG 13.99]MDV3002788.1 hypothetical protein [Chroococcopsis gigantea SAG 12.99]